MGNLKPHLQPRGPVIKNTMSYDNRNNKTANIHLKPFEGLTAPINKTTIIINNGQN